MHTNPFAIEAAQYAHLRPTYPDSLFAFLSTTVTLREVAWDCAAGNGQAATHLAKYFGRVIATDESAEMLGQAPRHPRIEYRVSEAEDSGIEADFADLVTVASAIHWFDLSKFYAEVGRVVKPGGVIAAWTYYTPVFGNDVDVLIECRHTSFSPTIGTSACTTSSTSSTTCPSRSSRSKRHSFGRT